MVEMEDRGTRGAGLLPLLVLGLGVFAVGTGGYVFVGVLEPLSTELSVSIELAGQLAAVFALTRAIGSPLLVGLTAAVPRRTLLLASLLVFTAAQGVAALSPSFAALMGARVLAALGAAIYGPVALATGASLVPSERRGRALALVASGLGAAFVLGIPLGTFLGGLFGWRVSFVVAGVLGVLALLGISMGLPKQDEPRRRTTPPPLARRGGVLRQVRVWMALAITTIGFASIFVLVAYIGPLVSYWTESGSTGIGIIQIMIGVGSVAGIIAGGQAADRIAPAIALAAVFVFLALGHLSLWLIPTFTDGGSMTFFFVSAALMLGAFATFAMIPLQQVQLIRIAPERPEVALALNGSAIFLGQALGAGLGGAMASFLGLGALGIVALTVALLGLVVLSLSTFSTPASGLSRS